MMTNKPLKIYLFYCTNSLDTDALRTNLPDRGGDTLKTVSLPCSGKVNLLYLLKAFETGADGVMLVTCKKGECSFLEGNLRAHRRAEAVDSLLKEIGPGTGRMKVIQQEGKGGLEHILTEMETLRRDIQDTAG
jgi:coenzyme F420-reducing hydrogenase delta subunit